MNCDASRFGVAVSGAADASAYGVNDPSVPPADHGNTRYSIVSEELFAANVTQPESVAGLTDAYAATASDSWVACAPHDAVAPGPLGFLTQAATIAMIPALITMFRAGTAAST